jgi:hypothetical protein
MEYRMENKKTPVVDAHRRSTIGVQDAQKLLFYGNTIAYLLLCVKLREINRSHMSLSVVL